jgi:hypothetical protein
LNRNSLIKLSIFTLLGFPAIGLVIHLFFTNNPFISIFISKSNLLIEVLVGGITGLIIGYLGWEIIKMKFMKPVLDKYKNMITSSEIDLQLIFFISFCAGVGEEILFRGVIQPLIGVWITSLIFVAIHGYLNPTNWRISIYGIYLTLSIALIGYLSNWLGLCTAIAAHMIIDVILFYKLKGIKLSDN